MLLINDSSFRRATNTYMNGVTVLILSCKISLLTRCSCIVQKNKSIVDDYFQLIVQR